MSEIVFFAFDPPLTPQVREISPKKVKNLSVVEKRSDFFYPQKNGSKTGKRNAFACSKVFV